MLFVKAFLRFFSFSALVLAVLLGVLDAVRSVSTHRVDLLSAYDGLANLWPQSLAFSQSIVEHYIHPEAWRSIVALLNDIPASGGLLVLALLMWVIGYKKPRSRLPVFASAM